MRTVNTENSSYVIDEDNKLIRRYWGINPPTLRQGPDDTWKAYEDILLTQGGLLIVWGVNPDGSAKCTLTSNVISDTKVIKVKPQPKIARTFL